jgi:hypothetical protein
MNILSNEYRGDRMSQFLDARTSQNASYDGSISIELTPNTPTHIGVVGLNVIGASGVIRVTFNGVAVIELPDMEPILEGSVVVVIGVVRGSNVFDQSQIVGYEFIPLLPTDTGVKVLNLTLSDYNVPYPSSNELVYSPWSILLCWRHTSRPGKLLCRCLFGLAWLSAGECLNGSLYCEWLFFVRLLHNG